MGYRRERIKGIWKERRRETRVGIGVVARWGGKFVVVSFFYTLISLRELYGGPKRYFELQDS